MDFLNYDKDWAKIIEAEKDKDYYINLTAFLEKEYDNYIVYPRREEIFSALNYTSFKNTKVVILGQDPYHGEDQAHGLAFSVKMGTRIPPSLVNIFKELSNDLHIPKPGTGYLEKWAKQGVLLLNTVLTVRAGEANSHKKIGWEQFTDKLIVTLNNSDKPIVFLLWGRNAQEKEKYLTNKNHLVLKAAHPSPLSATRGFLGCRHFSRTNEFLRNNNIQEIDWSL